MVTKSEQQVVNEYKNKEYFHVHCGSPDFIFYKVKANQEDSNKDKSKQYPTINDIDIDSVEFCEVKYNGDNLSHEQLIWKHILTELGLRYKLINIPTIKDFGVS